MLNASGKKGQLSNHRHPILWAAGFATAAEAAEILSCSLRSVRYMQAKGELPPRHRRGRTLLYRRADIMKMLRRGVA
jgi:hypothetical protein